MKSSIRSMVLVAALATAGAGYATPMEDLKKDGYSCERGGVDSIVCTKSGSPTKYCDNAGQCTRTTAGTKGTVGANQVTGVKAAESKKSGVKGGAVGVNQTMGVAELTEQECERLGGVVTAGIPNDSTCKTNVRCKTTLANGDIRSICVDEVAP